MAFISRKSSVRDLVDVAAESSKSNFPDPLGPTLE